MKKQEEKSLDKLFEGLNELQQEQPSAAFLEDLELRLDALEKKKRKPLFAWWVWSVLGAVVIVAGLIGYSNKSSFGASNASNRNSSPYQTATKSPALKQTSAPTSAKSSTSSFNLTSSTVTPPRDQSFSSSSAISSSSISSFSSLSSSTPIKNRDGSSTQVLREVQSNNDLSASNSSFTSN
ncbi:MAG: hypothetical protein RL078_1444, partial [Bacteroidota bacterium]